MLTDEQIAQTFKAMEDIYDMADGEGFIWPVDYENMRAIKAEIDRLTTKADEEGARVIELEAAFNMRWDADMRAIDMWQDRGGDALMMPDHADLCVWLLSQLAEAQWIIEKARYPHDANHFRPTPEESRWNKKRANWLNSHPEQDKEG